MPDLSEIRRKANEARELQDNPIFKAVMQEMLDAAGELFFLANSGIEDLSRAHEGVRAVQKINDALQARIDAETFAIKAKGQDRGSD